MENSSSKKINWKKELVEWIKAIAITLVVGIAITTFVRPTVVVGESMSNTLQPYDYLLVYRRAYKTELPKYNDIVLAQSNLPLEEEMGLFGKIKKLVGIESKDAKKIIIKRVIGLPNDVIKIEDGFVYRNGEKLEENYTRDGVTYGDGVYLVPEEHVFLMGDNRQGSADSRDDSIGMVPEDALLGKIIIRIFPFNKITTKF